MAMTGRLYTTGFQNVTLSAAQDAIIIFPGASKIVGIHQVNLGQITGTSVANARIRLQYLPATVTSGSGGGAGTINRVVSGDAAATAASRINDTTQATSGSTIVDLVDDVWNTVNGYVWYPPVPGRPFIIPLSGAFRVGIDTALSSFVSNGSVTFEELP